MIAHLVAFLVGFALVKCGLPWCILLIGILMLTVGDTIVRRACVDEAVQDGLNR